jgi:hypothetical protein
LDRFKSVVADSEVVAEVVSEGVFWAEVCGEI